jgi:hypothetical protein
VRSKGLLFWILLISFQAKAQEAEFYDPSVINEIRISFTQPDWRQILDSLFLNQGDTGRLIGDVQINEKQFKDAGIRYKGFSSWNSGEIKNPFNIDLDYVNADQDYQGFAKIKLSNVIHDPSFIREVLSYEIARQYMPAPKANYARLFINDEPIGLYTNVEAIDKRFVKSRFGDNDRSFFKGEPETLIYPFGQNANLALTHGNDSSGYQPFYKMESNAGWDKLFELIRVLNTSADSLDMYLNIDRALWMHAFNYAFLNLDSYIGYAQNYYLYEDENGRFNPLIWDMNMSFGSFRDSDGSTNFLGVTIPKLKVLDPLQHLKFSISPRPLMSKLFVNDTLKRMYLAHIRTMLKENIDNNSYYERTKSLQELIRMSVMADTNKFYSFQDFLQNADTTVGGTGSMILYPGIRDLMQSRSAYLHSYKGISGCPLINSISSIPAIPDKGATLKFVVDASQAEEVMLSYRPDRYSAFQMVSLLDDGSQGDLEAGDGLFTGEIQIESPLIQYYFYAQNDSSGIFSPERAEYEYYTLQSSVENGDIVINEVKPGVNGWVEILNRTTEKISLENFSLAFNQMDLSDWIFPAISIEKGAFILIESGQKDLFDNKLAFPDEEGDKLILKNADSFAIDSVSWFYCPEQKTIGRYPNGKGPYLFMEPTAGSNNLITSTPNTGFRLYPNPASSNFTLEFIPPAESFIIEVYSAAGQCITRDEFRVEQTARDAIAVSYDCSYKSGLYFVRIVGGNWQDTRKLIVN